MIVNPILYQQGTKLPELENPGTAADLLAGKQLVDQYGNPLTGTMPTATHPKPTLSRSGGTVTAKHVQSSGYTEGGTATETLTIPTKAGTTIMPGTSRKTAVSSGYLTTGAVYVAGDANLKAENIKSGVSIFGVSGNIVAIKTKKIKVINKNKQWRVIAEYKGADHMDDKYVSYMTAQPSSEMTIQVISPGIIFFRFPDHPLSTNLKFEAINDATVLDFYGAHYWRIAGICGETDATITIQ